MQQREMAAKIVEFSAELDFAKDRYQKNLQAAEHSRQETLKNKLKPKGHLLLKKQ